MSRKKKEPNPAYDKEGYQQQLLRLQKSEVLHMIDDYDFNVSELIDAMWNPTMVRLLREVAPYAAEQSYTEDFSYQGRFRLTMTHAAGIAMPRAGCIRIDDRRLIEFLQELDSTVRRWDRANKLIEHLYKKHPMSEVRYVLPQLAGLVPPDHFLRHVKPVPAVIDYEQAADLRETVATLSRGMLSNPDRPLKNDRNTVGFNVFYGDWSLSPLFWVA